jgi:uncharacterized membrane protein
LSGLAGVLWELAPKFVSWVISFVTVCVIWLNHHRLFKLMSQIDNGLFWWSANLLLWTSFIPFPTALMGAALSPPEMMEAEYITPDVLRSPWQEPGIAFASEMSSTRVALEQFLKTLLWI